MLCKNLFHLKPLLESLLSDLSFAHITQILYLSQVRVTGWAKVLEEYVHNEVVWNDLPIVFADILWTKLHLTRFNIVPSLNERCVEHQSRYDLVREACMLEHYLRITMDSPTHLLSFREKEDRTLLLLIIKPVCRICEYFFCLETPTIENFKERHTASIRIVWHLEELDSLKPFHRGWLYFVSIEGFEVVEVTKLAWLTHSFTICESLNSIEP